jgi:hypothetical protein
VRTIRVRNRERDADLGDRIAVADKWWPQLRGLLGRPEPQPGEGLLIVDSQAIHMYGMKYPIDVAIQNALEGEIRSRAAARHADGYGDRGGRPARLVTATAVRDPVPEGRGFRRTGEGWMGR